MVHRFKNSHQDGVVAVDKRVFLIYKTGFRVRGKKSCFVSKLNFQFTFIVSVNLL